MQVPLLCVCSGPRAGRCAVGVGASVTILQAGQIRSDQIRAEASGLLETTAAGEREQTDHHPLGHFDTLAPLFLAGSSRYCAFPKASDKHVWNSEHRGASDMEDGGWGRQRDETKRGWVWLLERHAR